MFEQGQDSAADEVDRRFVAGHQQENGRRQHLALAERVALLLGRRQPAQQIGARGAAPVGQQLEEVLGEGHHGVKALLADRLSEP